MSPGVGRRCFAVALAALTAITLGCTEDELAAESFVDLGQGGSISILGAQQGDHLSAVAAGDVNGDGTPDLVVGASGATAFNGEEAEAGAAYLLNGPLTRSHTWDLGKRRADSIIRGAHAGDKLGRAVAMGDLNGDGLVEVIVAAPEADGFGGSRADSGEVYLFLGSRSFAQEHDLAQEPPFLTFVGVSPGDIVGWSLFTADLNGDDLDDLMIGAPFASGTAADVAEAGRVYVFFGSPDLPRSTIDLGTRFPGATIVGTMPGGRLGWSLTAGDTDGDGSPELILGAPFTDPDGERRAAGRLYALVPPQPGETKNVDELAATLVMSGQRSGDQVGYSLAAGDINGDGADDILAGAVSADGPAGARDLSGAAFVAYGGGQLELDLASVAPDNAFWGARPSDRLGRAVALGDLDSDGKHDLILAAPTASSPDASLAKAGLLLAIGASSRLPAQFDLAARDPDLVVVGPQPDAILGHGNFGRPSLVTADLDGDARADMIVAAPAADPKDRDGAGAIYVILGRDLALRPPTIR